MKKILFSVNLNFLLFLIFFGFAVSKTFAQASTNTVSPLPAPTGFVNDYVGVIDAATKQRLEQKLKELKERNNPPIELAVAVVDTTGDRPIFDYSLAVARGWGIGSKDLDNPSALLFIAINDRKYFTQVSRDLEDELPDGLVGSLQRQYLVPEFKKANYGKGIEDTIDAYIDAIQNRTSGTIVTTSPTPRRKKHNFQKHGGIPIQMFLSDDHWSFGFIQYFQIIFRRRSRRRAAAADLVRLCRGLSVRQSLIVRAAEAVGEVRIPAGHRAAVRIGAVSAAAAISAAAARAAIGKQFSLKFQV